MEYNRCFYFIDCENRWLAEIYVIDGLGGCWKYFENSIQLCQ